jgi:coenzyme F420 hydrogenase subunit beta
VTMSPPRQRAEMSGIAEAPGKVWFWELAAAVIDADRCVQCGACVAACPTDSIGVGTNDLPKLVKMCTGCSLCWDFCPRGGMRYEATWLGRPPSAAADEDWKITGVDPAPGLGQVRESLAARVKPASALSTATAQDGGVVTAILLASLAAGQIDGAVVAREDPDHPWKGVPHLATTADEIRAAAGSFYNQTMALASIDLAAAGLAPDARIAVVGTPCEIQGIRALQSRQWRRGTSGGGIDSIVLTIALLCTKSFDYSKLMLRELRDERNVDLAEVGKVDVIHGRMIVEDRNGTAIVDEPVKDFHGAALKGCDECADFLGRGADISVGSVGSGPGYSSVLVRTEAGGRALEAVRGELEELEIEAPEALEKLDQLDKKIARRALHRPFQPDGPLFVDFEEHVTFYGGTDRSPAWRD